LDDPAEAVEDRGRITVTRSAGATLSLVLNNGLRQEGKDSMNQITICLEDAEGNALDSPDTPATGRSPACLSGCSGDAV
jgi:hypothetical protein